MVLISLAITAKLICTFVFAYAKCWFSHEATQILEKLQVVIIYVKGKFANEGAHSIASFATHCTNFLTNLWVGCAVHCETIYLIYMYLKFSKFRTPTNFYCKIHIKRFYHSEVPMLWCKWNSKQWCPWSDCSSRRSLIWVCPVCRSKI